MELVDKARYQNLMEEERVAIVRDCWQIKIIISGNGTAVLGKLTNKVKGTTGAIKKRVDRDRWIYR
jgi:hypothetical protein